MKRTVYIETTVPSYYYETRADARSVAWREITRAWWDTQRQYYDCYTSFFTLFELNKPTFPLWKEKLSLVEGMTVLQYDKEIDEIIQIYVRNFVMPDNAQGDAAHLAMASYHSMDYLITWNCNNLANANSSAILIKLICG
jgi:hypothetical protein